MKQEATERESINLVGICVRTSYEQELNNMEGKIFPCVQNYFHNQLADEIPNRKNPGTTYCVYADYESDHRGAYTYFIGEEVSSIDPSLPEGLSAMTIPKQKYAKFTTEPAPMPDVIVNAWTKIWEMSLTDLGGDRNYVADFEIYDQRAADHNNIVLDLYIGIN